MSPVHEQQSDPQSVPQARRAVAGRYAAELLPRGAYDAAYTPDCAIVGFAFEARTGIHAFASDRRTSFRARPNGLAYVPPGCEVYSRSLVGGEYLRVTVASGHDGALCGHRRLSDVIDIETIRAARRIRTLLLAGELIDPIAIEFWLDALIARAGAAMRRGNPNTRASAWMTPRRLQLIEDLVEARLGERLTVFDLATALGLSTGFLSRAFKAALGTSPHDYIVDRRIARARAMLSQRDLELSVIALNSGFSSHAHMTATFQSRLGVTPSEFRTRLV